MNRSQFEIRLTKDSRDQAAQRIPSNL